MEHIGKPGDVNYLLRGLDHTTCRFRVAHRAGRDFNTDFSTVGQEALSFVKTNPGATIRQIRASSPPLKALSHVEIRTLVVGLVDAGALEVAGQAPLVEVDPRYESVPACDICHARSDQHPIIFWKYNTPVVRCTVCGLLYSNPRWKAEHLFGRYTTEFWQQYADKVKSTALDPAANQERWDPYLSTVAGVRKTGRLLDVGCATGEFLTAAKARGWEVYGVEPSSIAARCAEQATGAAIHAGTIDTAPFANGMFDVVTLWDVIEHVQSPRTYLEQAARLLRSGGLLALTTPNIRSMNYWLLGANWPVVGPNDHIYYFAPRTIQRLLMECGFKIYVMQTATNADYTGQQWAERPIARALRRVAQPFVTRFLWGEELYIVAQLQ